MADNDRLHDILDKVLMFGLGAATATADGISKFVDEMVKRGEMSRPEAEQFTRKVTERAEGARDALKSKIREEFDRLVKEAGLVRADEVKALHERIDALERSLKESAPEA